MFLYTPVMTIIIRSTSDRRYASVRIRNAHRFANSPHPVGSPLEAIRDECSIDSQYEYDRICYQSSYIRVYLTHHTRQKPMNPAKYLGYGTDNTHYGSSLHRFRQLKFLLTT